LPACVRASRVSGEAVSGSRTLSEDSPPWRGSDTRRKDCFGATPKPARHRTSPSDWRTRETPTHRRASCALPRIGANRA
jgi:hypothetical protein